MILNIAAIVISVLLIIVILMQVQGSGLSASFGGSGGENFRSRRSMDKALVYATVVLAILFALVAILLLIP